MKINRQGLISELGKVLPGIATGTIAIEGADALVFRGGHIYSYNSVISVNLESKVMDQDLQGIVKAQEFYNCLSKLPSDEIDLEEENGAWVIHDGNIRASLTFLSVDNIYERFDSLKSSAPWTDINGEKFKEALRFCIIKGNNSSFAGVYFNGNVAVSTNKWTISKYSLTDNLPKFWISQSCAEELVKWDFSKVQLDKAWLNLMSNDGVVFSVRTLNTDSYPLDRMLGVFDNALKKTAVLDINLNDNFYNALERAMVFSEEVEEHDTVVIAFGKRIAVCGKRTSGSYEEIVDGIECNFDETFELSFDYNEFLTSRGLFSNFRLLSDTEKVDPTQAVHAVLVNEQCTKLFSSLISE